MVNVFPACGESRLNSEGFQYETQSYQVSSIEIIVLVLRNEVRGYEEDDEVDEQQ